MEFKVFNEILLAAKRIDNFIVGIEKALDVQIGEGLLVEAQADLLNLLVNECEYDTKEDSIIYRYAFEDHWGEKPRIYYIENISYIIDGPESLYKYLIKKFDYEFKKENLNG